MKRLPPNPPASSELVARVMSANRAAATWPERRVRAALAARGIGGYRLNARGVTGRPDVAFVEGRVAVFVHGCFWHHCPLCHRRLPRGHRGFWKQKFQLNKKRDARKRGLLEEQGWRVLELWECQIRDALPRCMAEIEEALRGANVHVGTRQRPYGTTPHSRRETRSKRKGSR